ncbi:class I SAM-dependent methyltransferase [Altererythrobacter aquiaggeris]|uniref:class I SAM-dependent methyltransferase n=1 Tax=Aestuarierythrobacter aquiaggeris TaxID=1898396 RepID=UPI00301B5866
MTDSKDWQGQVGETWSREWRRTDRSFSGLTDQLLRRATQSTIRHALDVGCGAGELTLALARSNPDAKVRGIDISEDLIEIARGRSANANVHFAVMDATEWNGISWRPDLIMSRHGVMFFKDPVQSFYHLRMSASENARLVFSCFQRLAANPWVTEIARLLPEGAIQSPEPGYRPGPFAFANRDFVSETLRSAGWQNVEFEPVEFAYIAGAGEDPVDDAVNYLLRIGPGAAAARELGDAAREVFKEKLRRFLASRARDGLVALGASAWIVTAHN